MRPDEYLKMAEVEDRMWYFQSLHGHIRRELEAGLADRPASGKNGRPAGAPQVLDAGCGTGGLIIRLRPAHPEWNYSGIDFMPLACELARERCGGGVDIREASVTALPFAERSFDAVVSADVICQVDEPGRALAEFFRVLRPGGLLVINVPAYMWLWSYHDEAVHTKRRYTRPELAGLMRAASFEDVRTTHWNALPFPLVWAKRKLLRGAGGSSDVQLFPAPVEAAFRGAMAIEHAWVRAGGRWAWGSSVLAVARKPETVVGRVEGTTNGHE